MKKEQISRAGRQIPAECDRICMCLDRANAASSHKPRKAVRVNDRNNRNIAFIGKGD